jgi:L-malate glycosyltransferase
MRGRVFQIVESLERGDGVSNIALGFAPLLAELGAEPRILVANAHPTLRAQTLPFESIEWRPDDTVIVHVWGYTRFARFLRAFSGRKAIYFHNITPPEFFAPGSLSHRSTRAGWEQLPALVGLADMWVAPSAYNLAAVAAVGGAPRRQQVIAPPIECDAERSRPFDARRLASLRAHGETNILFVGRLAPNKAQHRVMEVFEHYYTSIDRRSRLHLVGNGADNPGYVRSLHAARERLNSGRAIEIPGKVSDEELQAYYRGADLFLCLSEHEGLCLPPLSAAAHGVPVLARAAAALPETVGPAAVLIHEYDPARIAELAHVILEEAALRERLKAAAERHLARFTGAAVKAAWSHTLSELGE